MRQAAIELAPFNVLVNAIAPGAFGTKIGGNAPRGPARAEAIRAATLLGGIAKVQETVGLPLPLGPSAAGYMAGSIVVIDGGKIER